MLIFITKLITTFCFLILTVYWYITARSTQQHKPKRKDKPSSLQFAYGQILPLIEFFIVVQLLGVSVYSFSSSVFIEITGFSMTILGLAICIVARKTLADNWTNAYEYQVKKNHELVTSGIYSIIRHPIYLGITLMFIGGELVVGSFLAISFLAFFIVFYVQGRREEKLLLAHFGKEYQEYMKHTKMLIPYIL